MAFKFYDIKKANAEIERLEGENATLTKNLADASQTPEAVSKHAEELTGQVAKLTADLASAQKQVTELSAAKVALETAAKDFTATLEAKSLEVDKLAAAKALEITAKQGHAPVVLGDAPANPAASAPDKKDLSHLKGLDRVAAAINRDLGITK